MGDCGCDFERSALEKKLGPDWARLAQVTVPGGDALSWRVTARELRFVARVGGREDQDTRFQPDAAAAAGAAGRIVDIDAGATLRAQWSRGQVSYDVIMDYGRGHSFGVYAQELLVSARARISTVQIWPLGGVDVLAGATIEAADAATQSYPPTRTKDTGVIAAAGDNVLVEIPSYARAWRWHVYQQSAAGAPPLTFTQSDTTTARVRNTFNASTGPSTWPPGGWVPVIGTSKWVKVQNNDAAITCALWLEFQLDVGG